DARLAAVVDGNTALIGFEPFSRLARNGAGSGWSRTSSHPRPSTTSTHARSAAGSSSVFSNPSSPSDPSTDGTTSASDPRPYGGGSITPHPPDRTRAPSPRVPSWWRVGSRPGGPCGRRRRTRDDERAP